MRVVYLSFLVALMLQIAQISAKGDKADQLNPNINGLGHLVKKKSLLTKFPMTVKSCDEIAIFQAKYITDLKDYKLRADGWFSVSAYTVNIYKDKDANQLIQSVDVSNFKTTPHDLMGARGCIIIEAGTATDMTICMGDKSITANLLNVIDSFYRCRRGDNLEVIPDDLIKKLIKYCSAIKKANTPKKITPIFNNKWDRDRVRYHHPVGLRVPGTF
jgi:hypothetical protein